MGSLEEVGMSVAAGAVIGGAVNRSAGSSLQAGDLSPKTGDLSQTLFGLKAGAAASVFVSLTKQGAGFWVKCAKGSC